MSGLVAAEKPELITNRRTCDSHSARRRWPLLPAAASSSSAARAAIFSSGFARFSSSGTPALASEVRTRSASQRTPAIDWYSCHSRYLPSPSARLSSASLVRCCSMALRWNSCIFAASGCSPSTDHIGLVFSIARSDCSASTSYRRSSCSAVMSRSRARFGFERTRFIFCWARIASRYSGSRSSVRWRSMLACICSRMCSWSGADSGIGPLVVNPPTIALPAAAELPAAAFAGGASFFCTVPNGLAVAGCVGHRDERRARLLAPSAPARLREPAMSARSHARRAPGEPDAASPLPRRSRRSRVSVRPCS